MASENRALNELLEKWATEAKNLQKNAAIFPDQESKILEIAMWRQHNAEELAAAWPRIAAEERLAEAKWWMARSSTWIEEFRDRITALQADAEGKVSP